MAFLRGAAIKLRCRRVIARRPQTMFADNAKQVERCRKVRFGGLAQIRDHLALHLIATTFASQSERMAQEALRAAATRVVDWAAGTRIGASLKVFNDVWGRRALTRGAAVLIVSDGWERDDNALLGREMARLHRAAFAVVWVSPLKGSSSYEPLAGGMQAALPFVDRFVAGHNLASLEELAVLLSGLQRRHGG